MIIRIQTKVMKPRTRVSREPLTIEEVEGFFQDFQNACLAMDAMLTRCFEFEKRVLNQLEESGKATEAINEMKEKMRSFNF